MIVRNLIAALQKNIVDPRNVPVIYGDGDVLNVIVGHNVLITSQKIVGHCAKCGTEVVKSLTDGYRGYCFCCDEDKFKYEITRHKEV